MRAENEASEGLRRDRSEPFFFHVRSSLAGTEASLFIFGDVAWRSFHFEFMALMNQLEPYL